MNGKKIGVNQNSVQANSPISSSPSIKIAPTGTIRVGYLHTTAYSTLQDAFQALNNISIDSNMIVAINQTNANEMSFLKAWQSQFRA